MIDPLSTYFSPQEQGLATILPRTSNKRATDVIEQDEILKGNQQAKGAKAAQDLLGDIPDFKPGRFFHEKMSEGVQGLIGRVATGQTNLFEAQQELAAFSQIAQAGTQVAEDFTQKRDYFEDLGVVDMNNLTNWATGIFEEATLQDAYQFAKKPPTYLEWLDDPEKSKDILLPQKAMRKVVEESFDDMLAQQDFDLGNWQRLDGIRGVMTREQEIIKSKMRLFAEPDLASNGVRVKDWDVLRDEGVLDVFKSDPYAAAVIRNRALEMSGGQPINEQLEAQALHELLQPYVDGEFERIGKTQQGRHVDEPASRGNQRRETEMSQRWLNDFRAGNQEAAGYLAGMELQRGSAAALLKPIFESEEWRGQVDDLQVDYVRFNPDGTVTVEISGTAGDSYMDENGLMKREGDIVKRIERYDASTIPDNALLNIYKQQEDLVGRGYDHTRSTLDDTENSRQGTPLGPNALDQQGPYVPPASGSQTPGGAPFIPKPN
jgi:hypothetical protein